MNETYLYAIGQHPKDVETEHTYQVQSRKRHGRYVTRLTTKRRAHAYFWYVSLNIGYGYAKRLLCDGTVMERAAS